MLLWLMDLQHRNCVCTLLIGEMMGTSQWETPELMGYLLTVLWPESSGLEKYFLVVLATPVVSGGVNTKSGFKLFGQGTVGAAKTKCWLFDKEVSQQLESSNQSVSNRGLSLCCQVQSHSCWRCTACSSSSVKELTLHCLIVYMSSLTLVEFPVITS